MRLATLPNETVDGRLHLVSRDNRRCAPAEAAMTLQSALESWASVKPLLEAEYEALNAGGGEAFDPTKALAPLPRAWQWLDASAFESHGNLMDTVFNMPPKAKTGRPLMYQGISDRFYPPTADVPFVTEEDGIDFEGEFGIITTETPIGTSETATDHIALVIQVNDWSLRKLGAAEMKTGFGWVQSKPACAMAPVALTPDELGDAWRDHRVDLPLNVFRGETRFGAPQGYEMGFGFDQLVKHAAYSRVLPAGTVIGSGTVSNENYREVGSACIAERRGIETIDDGAPVTPFLSFGEGMHMECVAKDGSPLFGAITQTVVKV